MGNYFTVHSHTYKLCLQKSVLLYRSLTWKSGVREKLNSETVESFTDDTIHCLWPESCLRNFRNWMISIPHASYPPSASPRWPGQLSAQRGLSGQRRRPEETDEGGSFLSRLATSGLRVRAPPLPAGLIRLGLRQQGGAGTAASD